MGARVDWSRVGRAPTRVAGVLVLAGVIDLACAPSWPKPESAASGELRGRAAGPDRHADRGIRAQTICVATRADSAGTLGASVLYHFRRQGSTLRVGYFVHWTTERPWGDNVLTYTLLPALVTDAFYSHFLFVLPGLQRVMYGPGDVEGALVVYEERPDGSLAVLGGAAENGAHEIVELRPDDLLDEQGRIVLASDVWSHQLGAGARHAKAAAAALESTCFREGQLAPLTEEVARDFRLGTAEEPQRARVAWLLEPPASIKM